MAGAEDEDSPARRIKVRKTPLRTVLAGHFSKSVGSGAPPVIIGGRSCGRSGPPARAECGVVNIAADDVVVGCAPCKQGAGKQQETGNENVRVSRPSIEGRKQFVLLSTVETKRSRKR